MVGDFIPFGVWPSFWVDNSRSRRAHADEQNFLDTAQTDQTPIKLVSVLRNGNAAIRFQPSYMKSKRSIRPPVEPPTK